MPKKIVHYTETGKDERKNNCHLTISRTGQLIVVVTVANMQAEYPRI